jgi:hypothetical protein
VSNQRAIEVDEVQAIGAEVMVEFERIQHLPPLPSEVDAFLRVSRLLGIAALKALPEPTPMQLALLRQAISET